MSELFSLQLIVVSLLSDFIRLSVTVIFKTLRTVVLIPTEFVYIHIADEENKHSYILSKSQETNCELT